MRYAIWGSKNRARKLATCVEHEIDYFIDNDKSRKGTFNSKMIVSPEDIDNWTELFVYVPDNIYAEIAPMLINKGLKENINFQSCFVGSQMKISFHKIQTILNQCERNFRQIEGEWDDTIVFFSGQSYINFFAKMVKNHLPVSFFAEDYTCDIDALSKVYQTEFKFLSMTPIIDPFFSIANGQLEAEQMHEIINTPILYSTMLQFREWYQYETNEDLSSDSSCCMIYVMKTMAEMFANIVHPKRVICHGSSFPFHRVLAAVCKLHGVPVGYTHEGVIPGTYVIESGGEMGHSLPAIFSELFLQLPVSEEELAYAHKVWNYLFESKLNRKRQPHNDIRGYIYSRLLPHRPTVFFAGQNDIGSHMVPYTAITQKYHSPIFRSSFEAATYLAHLCEKNGWNFIYKPHPDYAQPKQRELLPSNTIFLAEADINELIDIADVTVTILSTTNYNALIRYKPVVMLGYNQIRGKGCTYEAFQKEHIEKAIMDALQYGFTKEQQAAFLKHMAQCLKYYLYDDLQDRPIRYGRALPKCIDDFFLLEKALGVENKKNTFEDELHEL